MPPVGVPHALQCQGPSCCAAQPPPERDLQSAKWKRSSGSWNTSAAFSTLLTAPAAAALAAVSTRQTCSCDEFCGEQREQRVRSVACTHMRSPAGVQLLQAGVLQSGQAQPAPSFSGQAGASEMQPRQRGTCRGKGTPCRGGACRLSGW